MKREALLKLISESKPLLRTASPQQKIRLLRLIKEGLKQYNTQKIVLLQETETIVSCDYLEEK